MISALRQQKKSILLSYQLSFFKRTLPYASLVDSGCTGEAFLDSTFAKTHGIPTTPLPHPRPLYLADGQLRDWIRETATLELQIGPHKETISLFITPLAEENPVILGIPWLQRHNPLVDWQTLDLRFQNYGTRCLPPGAETLAPRVPDAEGGNTPTVTRPQHRGQQAIESLSNYQPPSVEDSEEDDHGEVDLRHITQPKQRRRRR